MKQIRVFIMNRPYIFGYVWVFALVAIVNIYTILLNNTPQTHDTTWVITCFSAALYVAPIKHWVGVALALIGCHLVWQLLPLTGAPHWPLIATYLVGSVCTALPAKILGKLWTPSDFTGYFGSYLPGLLPIILVYVCILLLQHWMSPGSLSLGQITDIEFLFKHLHLLEFAATGNMLFLVLQWYKRGFTLPKNSPLAILAVTAHLGLLYLYPHNFLPLGLIIGVSIYFTGLQGVAIPGLIAALFSPFIMTEGEPLIRDAENLDYAILIFVMGLIGLMRDGFIAAAKNGEPYKLVLSKSGTVGLTMASPDVDALRLELKGKKQQISHAYSDLEQKNNHLQSLTQSLESQKQTYKQLVEVDELTGLKSRRYFSNLLADGIRNTPYSLLMIDLDNFKSVNDVYGHHAGDELLKACAKVMQQSAQQHGFAARLGGEEFCIALENKDIYEAQILAERLRYRLSQTIITISGINIHRSASIGVAALAVDSQLKDAMSLADAALYQAKDKGKNSTALADELFVSQWQKNKNSPKLDAILAGLANNEFQFYIQPICDNKTHKAVGFETLMRWHRSDGSILAPGSFLDIALSPPVYPRFKETSLGQIVPILMSLMSRNPNYYLAFNTDSTFIHSKEFVIDLISQFDLSDANPNCLVLELPETAIIDDQELVLSNVSLLRSNGFGISLDDFGMEHSNMDRIRDIPADFVKIDRSFIVQMEGNPRSLAIIKALVSMSKELDFEIIAEGIETLAQARLIEEAGVTRVQGYYYGRPQSVDYWLDQLDKGLL